MRNKDEEFVNAWTHLISSLACIIVLVYVVASSKITTFNKVAFLPMGLMSSWTFFSSYRYHISSEAKLKERNRSVDRTAIFLMILGCGLSASLTCINTVFSISMCILLCVIAGVATIAYNSSKDLPEWLVVTTYITIGWFATIPSLGIFADSLYTVSGVTPYILASGALYCIGIIFYTKDSVKWNHTIWHLFVMAGAFTHIFAHIHSITR